MSKNKSFNLTREKICIRLNKVIGLPITFSEKFIDNLIEIMSNSLKREKIIKRTQKFLDTTGPFTVLFGRFIPAIRPIVPFMLGISDLKAVRFYVADIIACCCWGIALALLVSGIGSILG